MPGVQIVEVCMASQHKTGGLLELGQLRQKLISSRGRSQHHQDITIDDLLRATKKLKILGEISMTGCESSISIIPPCRHGVHGDPSQLG